VGRHNSLSGSRRRQMTHLVTSHRKGQQENCPNMGLLSPLLNRRSELSIRNGVLLCKQLICHMMDYTCLVWRSVACTHVRRLQVLQSKCLRLVTATPWYVSNRQIYEGLGVPLFVDHITALTASFDSRLANMGNPLVRQFSRCLR
jgi:hypothetical protein